VNTLKVTIDSTEPFADALRVIGALYNVTLAQVDDTPALGTPSAGPRRTRRPGATTNGSSRRAGTSKTTQRAPAPKPTWSSPQAAAASTSEIRRWAVANGHTVSSRGTLPGAVRAAYAEAHKA
jgi:hypothetical protein